ncbi:hypothetical protein BFP72_14985 [Reichenbachiella sp. 5M10]|uniref:T9SS type A sorting domain-containing protein n=1 Tax=Reichenbachiella sp. 5M10 TaxID=1889772 RepID=UPI000C15102B|nr:T9SS type A sorting domain-containing protein [Reichenbachiella sp. 5M10]PIB36612.1 hypothetical protein BFP72_14985 [Reichenbachiella sp. 5M10]
MSKEYRYILFLLLVFIPGVSLAQCPTADFSTQSTVCSNENLTFENSSLNAESYQWDFCAGELFTTPTETIAYSIAGSTNQGQWYAFQIRTNGSIYKFNFPLDCGENINNTASSTPTGVSYNTAGTYNISLRAYNNDGVFSEFTQSITVTTSTAPNVSFSIDDSRCIGNTNTFTALVDDPGAISSYAWDFGDGNLEAGATTTHSYDASGTYAVTLSIVSTDGCTNTSTQEFTFYNAPTDPAFSYSAATLCSNSDISFTNLTNENGAGDVVTYLWDFNGEATSTDKDPVYAFATAGSKTVSMTAMIPGCTTTVYSDVIGIIEGPNASFIYTNNCFGEAIQFSNTSTGSDINGYTWDFGDASPASTDQNPSHEYTATGDYTISLTVSNTTGCETTTSQTVTVSDADKANFSYGEAIENIPVAFLGEDLTLSDDAVDSWSWDFDGLGTASNQNPSFTFQTPGDYTVGLTVTTMQGCEDSVSKTISTSQAQCPTADFSTQSTVCSNENLTFENSSLNAESYQWDFCAGELFTTPTETIAYSIAGSTNTRDIEIVSDGINWFGFVLDRNKNLLHRLDFGNSLDNTPVLNFSSDLGGILNSATPIQIVQENNQWYALIHNGGNAEILLLDFGSDLTNQSPSISIPVSSIGTTADNLGLEHDNNQWVAILSSSLNDNFTIINFGNSLTNTPDPVDDIIETAAIPGAGFADLSLFNQCGNWFGLAAAFDNKSLYRLDFGNQLFSSPSFTNIGNAIFPTNPLSIDFTYQMGQYIGFVYGNSGGSYRITLGNDLANPTLATETLTTTISGITMGLSLQYDQGQWYAFQIRTNGSIYKFNFPLDCGENINNTASSTPTGVSYNTAGTYNISLRAYNNDGVFSEFTQSITVTTSTAPNVSFSIDDSRCIGNTNTFTALVDDPGAISSYAWDFEGDGTVDSTEPNPSYQYPASGSYATQLTISDGTCSNLSVQPISIYPVPPAPSFAVSNSAPYCSHTALDFDNTTDESLYNGTTVSYDWDYGDSSSPETSTDGSHTYAGAGNYSIGLTMNIPGCLTTAAQEIAIVAGPNTQFSYADDCFGDDTQFTNLSTGDNLTHATWDFGDELGSSTLSSPSYEYLATGDYAVTLTMQNALGCVTPITRTVRINGLPEVAFVHTPGCEEQTIDFTDESSPGDALNNLQSWAWDFNSLGESDQQNPSFTFDESANYTVSLTVTNTGNCANTATQTVIVQPAPTADFSIDLGCIEGRTAFVDQSTSLSENQITSWYWVVDGKEYFTQNIDAVFDEAGSYTASLSVTPTNHCVSTIQKDFTIYNLPVVAFSATNNCDNEATVFVDESTTEGPALLSRVWDFDGEGTANGTQTAFAFDQAGDYLIGLLVEDELGCQNSTSQPLTVHASPTAAFTVDDEFGGAPLAVQFSNESDEGSSYAWDFGVDDSSVSTEENPSYTYTTNGDYLAELVTYNEFCSDSAYIDILVADPELDLQLTKIEARESNGTLSIWITAFNNSSFNLDGFTTQIDLEGQNSIYERYNEKLRRGESVSFPLNFSLSADNNNVEFLCVTLVANEGELTDSNPLNNEGCLNFEQKLVIEQAFPNPLASGQNTLYVQMVLPSKSPVQLYLIDATGNVVFYETFMDVNSGLNTIDLDVYSFKAGLYFVKVVYDDQEHTQKIIKQ